MVATGIQSSAFTLELTSESEMGKFVSLNKVCRSTEMVIPDGEALFLGFSQT